MKQTCKNCYYYNKNKKNKPGLCKYNPPVILDKGNNKGLFPKVDIEDWCSKWKNK